MSLLRFIYICIQHSTYEHIHTYTHTHTHTKTYSKRMKFEPNKARGKKLLGKQREEAIPEGGDAGEVGGGDHNAEGDYGGGELADT